MNAAAPDVLLPPGPRRGALSTLVTWRDAITSLGPTPWKWAALIALFGAFLESALTFGEARPAVPMSALISSCAAAAICWSVQAAVGVCAWAIAARPGVATDRRPQRLAVALAAATLLQAVLVPALVSLLLGRLDPCVLHECEGKDFSKVPSWLMSFEGTGHMLIFGALLFAWLEAHRRNREIEQRLLVSQQERAHLKRSAFDARLTAMRAQIDPQFLFDSLADVQAAYAVDTARGTATLDLLITYLRTALPRLRTEGSTIGAEAELVDAWLAVVASRRGGRPLRQVQVDADCLQAPFPATVLLPLVQWAAGDCARTGCEQVQLRVQRAGQPGADRLMLMLRVSPGRACGDDEPDPRRIRERLQAMYGEAASLSCLREEAQEREAGKVPASATVITLSWPDESADRNRC